MISPVDPLRGFRDVPVFAPDFLLDLYDVGGSFADGFLHLFDLVCHGDDVAFVGIEQVGEFSQLQTAFQISSTQTVFNTLNLVLLCNIFFFKKVCAKWFWNNEVQEWDLRRV